MNQGETRAEDIADAIVRLPRTLRAGGDVSMYELATRAGYFEHYDRIGEAVIKQRLRGAPELVDEWLAYSEDKRVGRGWYFRIVPDGGYEIGYYGSVAGQHSSRVYADRFEACARFVKQELEALRG